MTGVCVCLVNSFLTCFSKDSDLLASYRLAKLLHECYEGGAAEDLGPSNEDLSEVHLTLKEGFAEMLRKMAAAFGENVRVLLKTRVSSVTSSGGQLMINDEDAFDCVAICLPCGVLQNEVKSLFGSSSLCETWLEALKWVAPGSFEKVILLFEERFWDCDSFGTSKFVVSSLDKVCGAPVRSFVAPFFAEPLADLRGLAKWRDCVS
jgi:hypothetical protein